MKGYQPSNKTTFVAFTSCLIFILTAASLPCNDVTHYPKTFGTLDGNSKWSAFVSDVYGNFAVGGTTDRNVLKLSTGTAYPIVEYYQVRLDKAEQSTTDWLLWSKYFDSSNFIEDVLSLAINPQGTQLATLFKNEEGTFQTLAILSAYDGSIINGFLATFFKFDENTAVKGNSNSILLDQVSNLYISGTADHDTWQFGKFESVLSTGKNAKNSFKLQAKKSDSSCSQIDSMILHTSSVPTEGALGVFLWGKLKDKDSSSCKYNMVYVNSAGSPLWSMTLPNKAVIASNQVITELANKQVVIMCGFTQESNSNSGSGNTKYAFWTTVQNIDPTLGRDLLKSSTQAGQQVVCNTQLYRKYSIANSQCLTLAMSTSTSGYSLIQIANEISLVKFDPPATNKILKITYTIEEYQQRLTGGTFNYFTRPAFDRFVKVGYSSSYYDTSNSQATNKRQAFIAEYQFTSSTASSMCDFAYTISDSGQSKDFETIASSQFDVSADLKNRIQVDTTDNGLKYIDSIVAKNLPVTPLRWVCQSAYVDVPTVSIVAADSTIAVDSKIEADGIIFPAASLPTLSPLNSTLPVITVDAAVSQAIVASIFPEVIASPTTSSCFAQVSYKCTDQFLLQSMTFHPEQRMIQIDPGVFYTKDNPTKNPSFAVTIKITAFIPGYESTIFTDMTLLVTVTCGCSFSNVEDPYSSADPIVIPAYFTGTSDQVYDFKQVKSNAKCCEPTSPTITYSTGSDLDSALWAFDSSPGGGILTTKQNSEMSATYTFKMTYGFGISTYTYKRTFTQEFKSTIDCSSLALKHVSSALSDVNYSLNQGTLNKAIPLFEATDSALSTCLLDHQISIKDKDSTAPATGLFTEKAVNATYKSLQVQSTSQSDADKSPYTVTVKTSSQSDSTISGTYSFQIFVESCDTGSLTPSNDGLDTLYSTQEYSYTIKAYALAISVQPFTPLNKCGFPIVMRIEMYQGTTMVQVIPPFITFENEASPAIVRIYSDKRSDMKSYPKFVIKVVAEVNQPGKAITGYMIIPISLVVDNTGPPYFSQDLPQIIELDVNSPKTFNFPSIQDPDSEDEPTIVPGQLIFDQQMTRFITGTYPKFTFLVTDSKLANQTFPVIVLITDKNPSSPLTRQYSFNLLVKGLPQSPSTPPAPAVAPPNITQNQTSEVVNSMRPVERTQTTTTKKPSTALPTDPITVRISSVSQLGEIKIAFNQDVTLPDTNLTQLISSLKVVYERDNIQREVDSFVVVSSSSSEITVQVAFTEPLSVSSSYGYDKVFINFNSSLPITAAVNPEVKLLNAIQIESKVPPQLQMSAAAANLEASTKTTSNGLIVIICANIGLTLAGGFSMKKLWQLISTLQILVHYPLLNLPMQANVIMVLKGIQDISNLNIIPKGTIKSFIHSILRDSSQSVEGSFGDMGYDSDNTLENMGLVAILLVIAILIIFMTILLGKLCSKSQKVQFIVQKLKTKLMFNPIIQAQLKGYIKLNLSVFIALSHFSTLSPASIVINLVLIVYFVSVPFIITRFLTKQSVANLRDPQNKLKYGSLHINLKPTSAFTLMYTMLYLLRRFFLGVTIVAFSSSPLTQASVTLGTSLFMLVYLLHFKPHRSFNTRAFEVFNELTILSVTYLIMMNADIVTDDLLRYNIGWTIDGIIGLCIVANLVNVFINMGRKIHNKIKLFLIKKKVLKPVKSKPIQADDFTNLRNVQASQNEVSNDHTKLDFIQQGDDFSRLPIETDNSNISMLQNEPLTNERVQHGLRRLKQKQKEAEHTNMNSPSLLATPTRIIDYTQSKQDQSVDQPQTPPSPALVAAKLSLLKIRRDRIQLVEEKLNEIAEEKISSNELNRIEEIDFVDKLMQRARNAGVKNPRQIAKVANQHYDQ